MGEQDYPCQADKKGEFSYDTTMETPKIGRMKEDVDLTAKLKSPKDITVEGTFTFNGKSNKFKAKTGQAVKFKKLPLAPEKDKFINKIKLAGSTDPVQADAKLIFEVGYSLF
jgi:hypothetical protein